MEEKELLEQARKNAWSFPGLTPPNNAAYIGAIKTKEDTYFYYQDKEGNFYYDSQQMRCFELEMREAQKKKQQRKWREKKRAI